MRTMLTTPSISSINGQVNFLRYLGLNELLLLLQLINGLKKRRKNKQKSRRNRPLLPSYGNM